MSLLSTIISNLFNGVSQQPAELRDSSQAELQVNAVSSPAYGLRKRPGTTHIAKIGTEALNPKVHFINRDADEQYAVVASNGALKVFNAQTGAEIPVATPDGVDYLKCANPQEDLKLVSVADYTFMVNTQRPVQLNAGLVNAKDSLEGVVSFPIPLLQLPVVTPTDPTQNPTSPTAGTGGNMGLGTGTILPGEISGQWDPNRGWPTDDGFFTPGMSYGDTSWSDPGNTGGGTGGGDTGGSTGGTGNTGGSGSTEPLPATPITQNPDGTYPPNTTQNPGSYRASGPLSPMPDGFSEGDFLTAIKNLGFNSSQYVVLYQPPISCTFINDTGTSTVSGAVDQVQQYVASVMAGLSTVTNGVLDYTIITRYTENFGYTDETFPQIVIPDKAMAGNDAFINNQLLHYSQAVVSWSGGTGAYDPIVVRGVLAFDAEIMVPVRDATGATFVRSFPVRLSFPGCAPGGALPDNDGNTDLACGNPNLSYTKGALLFNKNTGQYDIPITGFTLNVNRNVLAQAGTNQIGVYPFSCLEIASSAGIIYKASSSITDYHPARKVKFNVPLAYHLVSKSALTQSNIGPYFRVLQLSGSGDCLEMVSDLSNLPF